MADAGYRRSLEEAVGRKAALEEAMNEVRDSYMRIKARYEEAEREVEAAKEAIVRERL